MVGVLLWATLLQLNFCKASLFLQYGEIKSPGKYFTETDPICSIASTNLPKYISLLRISTKMGKLISDLLMLKYAVSYRRNKVLFEKSIKGLRIY